MTNKEILKNILMWIMCGVIGCPIINLIVNFLIIDEMLCIVISSILSFIYGIIIVYILFSKII